MFFPICCRCYITDLLSDVVPVFYQIGMRNVGKFCELLQSGYDWFEDATAYRNCYGDWAVICNRYETRAMHDAHQDMTAHEAIEYVRAKRQRLFFDTNWDVAPVTFFTMTADLRLYNTIKSLRQNQFQYWAFVDKPCDVPFNTLICKPVAWDKSKRQWKEDDRTKFEKLFKTHIPIN